MWRLGGRLPLVVDSVVTVVSWNLNAFTLGQRGHKAALPDPLDWDVTLLQEVDQVTYDVLASQHAAGVRSTCTMVAAGAGRTAWRYSHDRPLSWVTPS